MLKSLSAEAVIESTRQWLGELRPLLGIRIPPAAVLPSGLVLLLAVLAFVYWIRRLRFRGLR